MIRPGHHRPLGTTTWMRFPDWPRDVRPPQLLDVIVQTDGPDGDPDEVRRAYEVFGVFETKTGYRLHCERIEYGTLPASLLEHSSTLVARYARCVAQAAKKTTDADAGAKPKGKERDESGKFAPGNSAGVQFKPGTSGRPGGRPRGLASATRDVLKAAVADGEDPALCVARFWASVMSDPAAKMEHRLEASRLIADRGWGKAPQFAPIEDEDPLEFGPDARELAEDFDEALDELARRRRAREDRVAAES